MECYICKKEIELEEEEFYRLRLPIGETGFVHKKHRGVKDEFLVQLKKGR